MNDHAIRIEPVALRDILPLRAAVLRPGRPPLAARFDGDDEPQTRHFAARDGANIVGCVTFHRRDWDAEPAWQMRGMAVHPAWRGRGVGSRLLRHCVRALLSEGPIRLLWCNARSAAVPFYERHGWQRTSELFHIESVGPHYRMLTRLGPPGDCI